MRSHLAARIGHSLILLAFFVLLAASSHCLHCHSSINGNPDPQCPSCQALLLVSIPAPAALVVDTDIVRSGPMSVRLLPLALESHHPAAAARAPPPA